MADQDDVYLWQNLKSRLQNVLDTIKPTGADWRYIPNLDIGYEEAKSHWLEECGKFEIQAQDSIVAWIRTGRLDEPHEQIRYFVAVRFDAACALLDSFLFLKNLSTIALLPFPPEGSEELLFRLLVEWWDGFGQLHYFDQLHAGKMLS